MLMEPQATNPAPCLNQAQTFGSYLRSERELRQITLAEVSAVTKIPLRTLEHLEEGQWDELPPQVFVRGFVRSYARCLRMCEQEATRAYERALDRAQRPAAKPPRSDAASDAPPDAEPDILGRRRFELALLVIIVVILATITLSLLWRRGGHTDIQAQVVPQGASPAVSEVLDRTRARG